MGETIFENQTKTKCFKFSQRPRTYTSAPLPQMSVCHTLTMPDDDESAPISYGDLRITSDRRAGPCLFWVRRAASGRTHSPPRPCTLRALSDSACTAGGSRRGQGLQRARFLRPVLSRPRASGRVIARPRVVCCPRCELPPRFGRDFGQCAHACATRTLTHSRPASDASRAERLQKGGESVEHGLGWEQKPETGDQGEQAATAARSTRDPIETLARPRRDRWPFPWLARALMAAPRQARACVSCRALQERRPLFRAPRDSYLYTFDVLI